MFITESIQIKNDISQVYQAFYDLNRWKDILPDIFDVKVLYDDGLNQEFYMNVVRPNGKESIRGIRYCTRDEELELFHPVPPPNIDRMVGKWQFYDMAVNSTKVIASREFILKPDPTSKQTIENQQLEFSVKLRGYLKTNLQLFKKALERS